MPTADLLQTIDERYRNQFERFLETGETDPALERYLLHNAHGRSVLDDTFRRVQDSLKARSKSVRTAVFEEPAPAFGPQQWVKWLCSASLVALLTLSAVGVMLARQRTALAIERRENELRQMAVDVELWKTRLAFEDNVALEAAREGDWARVEEAVAKLEALVRNPPQGSPKDYAEHDLEDVSKNVAEIRAHREKQQAI
jgi:hypothetical protein